MTEKLSLFFSNPTLAHLNFVVMDSKFRTLWSQHQNPMLKLQLSLVAENFLKFIKPNQNETFWSNSAQVGSLSENSHLFFSQLLTANNESFYVVFEYTFFGLKPFPPVPLDFSSEISADDATLHQLAAHCTHGIQKSHHITEKIKEIRSDFFAFVEKCQLAEKKFKIFSQREEIFTRQKQLIKQKFKDNPVSSVNKQTMIDGTLVKLHLNICEDQLVFDFSETQMKKNWGWPESMTNSLCYFLASHFFPIQVANHSSFSFLKIMHSRQSPLAAKNFCEVRHSQMLNDFFCFVKKSLEDISHRFVFSKDVEMELLADRQIELRLANETVKILVPAKNRLRSAKISLLHQSTWKPFSDFKTIWPDAHISIDQKTLRLTTPRSTEVVGWCDPLFAKVSHTDQNTVIDLKI